MAIVPVGTQEGTIIGLDGVPQRICKSDVARCTETQFRPPTYYDAAGEVTEDICAAVGVELPSSTTCPCGSPMKVLVPEALAAEPAGTPLYTVEYANDGTAIPDLALAGDILAAFIVETTECEGAGYWDTLAIEAPAGYAYIYVNPVSANESLIAAL